MTGFAKFIAAAPCFKLLRLATATTASHAAAATAENKDATEDAAAASAELSRVQALSWLQGRRVRHPRIGLARAAPHAAAVGLLAAVQPKSAARLRCRAATAIVVPFC